MSGKKLQFYEGQALWAVQKCW